MNKNRLQTIGLLVVGFGLVQMMVASAPAPGAPAPTTRETEKIPGAQPPPPKGKDGKDAQKPDQPQPLNEAQIVGILEAAHHAEALNGETIGKKTLDGDVRMFGQMAAADHREMYQQVVALAEKLKLKPEGSDQAKKISQQGDELYGTLKSKADKSVDKIYMDAEVSFHKDLLKLIDSDLLPHAQTAELKALIVAQKPAIQNHLSHASRIDSSYK